MFDAVTSTEMAVNILLKIKEETEETIIEPYVQTKESNDIAEIFKKFNTERENRKWEEYITLKRVCNKIKFQREDEGMERSIFQQDN
jgi:hypothetical protein